ncbi:MAG TPA: hypothetical protein VJR29_11375 [bacterium]|nr:hypothetical protein [bacterium]
MRQMKGKLGVYQSAFALFLFLFLFHITPFSRLALHSIVHDQGIHHTHDDAGEDHSQEDHTSGDIHDSLFRVVMATVNSGPKLNKQILGGGFPQVYLGSYNTLPDPEPPPFGYLDLRDRLRPLDNSSRLLSSPLRAPPSA